jgi:hypothetical protein
LHNAQETLHTTIKKNKELSSQFNSVEGEKQMINKQGLSRCNPWHFEEHDLVGETDIGGCKSRAQ